MHDLGPATSDEMVLAFIRAEIDSPKRAQFYIEALNALRRGRALVDDADLNDAHANCMRALVLGLTRGYCLNTALFRDFPGDTKWRRASLSPSDFYRLMYISKEEFWLNLTNGTRSPADAVANYKNTEIAPHVDEILKKIARGTPMPEVLLVDDTLGGFVILEGNTRVTAFAVALPERVEALVGTSRMMRAWHYI